ncbi:MAG: hypothetical protein CMN28_16750 [Salinisphaeraceae bacterium]|nr:hypothetical protein [Salinisphaeraceae bacterium]
MIMGQTGGAAPLTGFEPASGRSARPDSAGDAPTQESAAGLPGLFSTLMPAPDAPDPPAAASARPAGLPPATAATAHAMPRDTAAAGMTDRAGDTLPEGPHRIQQTLDLARQSRSGDGLAPPAPAAEQAPASRALPVEQPALANALRQAMTGLEGPPPSPLARLDTASMAPPMDTGTQAGPPTTAIAQVPATTATSATAAGVPAAAPSFITAGQPDAVADQVEWSLRQGLRQVELRLHPEKLGRVDIHMRLDGDQVSLQVVASTAAGRDTVEAGLHRLRDMLAEQGLNLAQSDVSDGSAHARPDHRDRETGPANPIGMAGVADDETPGAAPLAASAGSRGLLDTFA